MSTSPWSGTLVDAAGRGCRARIVGVAADGGVRAITASDDAGRWQLPADGALTRFVGVRSEDGIAAISTAAVPNATLVLPRTTMCHFDFDGAAPNTQLWLDPLNLDGFDDALLLALRAGPAGSILLHIGSFDAAADGLRLGLQAGRYRLSGGRIAIRPAMDPGEVGLTVGEVVDVADGRPLARGDGDWVLEIRQHAHYRVRFEAAP